MHLKLKPTAKCLCGVCGLVYFPAPNVANPSTCGRPECIKEYKRLNRERKGLSFINSDTYHQIVVKLTEKGMERELFLITVLGETGMTVGELCELRPKDIFFKGPEKMVALRQFGNKTGPRRVHRVSPRVASILESWVDTLRVRPMDPIFPYTRRTAHNMFRKALVESEVGMHYSTRALRHMYGFNVARATDDEVAVAKAMRMKDAASSRVYISMARELMEGA